MKINLSINANNVATHFNIRYNLMCSIFSHIINKGDWALLILSHPISAPPILGLHMFLSLFLCSFSLICLFDCDACTCYLKKNQINKNK